MNSAAVTNLQLRAGRLPPFSVAFFILGGGGYLQTRLIYTPDTGDIVYDVVLAVTASASLAIALGPIRGGVFIYFGVTANFTSSGNSNAFGVVFIIRGEVCLAGIVSAFVSLSLTATYNAQEGVLTGKGRLVVTIKICWCFTLEINEEVSYSLKAGGVKTTQAPVRGAISALGTAMQKDSPGLSIQQGLTPLEAANQYVSMLV